MGIPASSRNSLFDLFEKGLYKVWTHCECFIQRQITTIVVRDEQQVQASIRMDLVRVALCIFFCFAQVWSMPTNCVLSKDLMKESYTLLETAGGLFPMQCLEEKVANAFPKSAFESENKDQVTGVEKAVYQTLENIDALLENCSDPGQWDKKKWNDFRGLVYRQIGDSRCIMSKSQAAEDFSSREASLRAYFETVSSTLNEKEFSYCAWEIVRNEILQTLKFILENNSDILS